MCMLEEKNVNDVYDWVRVEPIEPTGLLASTRGRSKD